MNKSLVNQFNNTIRRILNEEVEKSSTGEKIYKRLPEVNHDKDYKDITPAERDTKSKTELIDDMTKLVAGINKDFTVVWDDHDDIMINARDLFSIRVIPKWENNYSIEAFTRNEDRIFVTGQSWDLVKEFVKINLKDAETAVDKAAAKVVKNREDQVPAPDKGLSQKDKPKILPLTNEPVKTTKNKDKNYTEEPKDNDDLPEKPMKPVAKDAKKLSDYKVKSPEKISKFKKNTDLVATDKKTPKFKETNK